MKALIKLHLKENLRKNSFIIFGILGGLITLITLSSVTFTTNAPGANSDYAQYGYQWTFLGIIASLAGVTLSMGTMAKHREGNSIDLLKLHGLSLKNQYASLSLGNILVSLLMALIMAVGMVINILVKEPSISIGGFFVALILYLIPTIIIPLEVSLLSLIFPSAVTALLGVFLILLGSIRGTLELMVGNMGGAFGNISGILLKLVPPISSFSQLARDFFFGDFTNWNGLFSSMLYLWILIGVSWVVLKVVERREG
ncbi:MAG: hypothetical protein GX666_05685 [Tissierellia bacterium]|nr:hypothetical protein [Tissierellia bacterium]